MCLRLTPRVCLGRVHIVFNSSCRRIFETDGNTDKRRSRGCQWKHSWACGPDMMCCRWDLKAFYLFFHIVKLYSDSVERWSTQCSYLVSKMWRHYGGEADYFVVIMTKSTVITHWRTCDYLQIWLKWLEKHNRSVFKEEEKIVGSATPGAICVAKTLCVWVRVCECVCVCARIQYIHICIQPWCSKGACV